MVSSTVWNVVLYEEHCAGVGRKVSVSNEHESNESNESTMKRDLNKEKNDAPKKRVVTVNERTQMTGNVTKDPVPKTENMEEAVPQREISKGLKVKGQKEWDKKSSLLVLNLRPRVN